MELLFASRGTVSVIIPDAGTVKFHVLDDEVTAYRDLFVSL